MPSAMTPGRAVGTMLVVAGLVGTLVALLVPIYFFDGNRTIALSRSGWHDDGKGTWKTEYGPVNSLDREFMRSLRTAGLWELPVARAAKERSTRRSVRIVGDHVVEGDSELDKRVIQAARSLKVTLPSKPTGPQQQWMDDIEAAKGAKFDQMLVNQMRKQNGKTIGLISLVRDQTRNSMVRSLASRANTIVLDHLSVLEETGLVDYGAISSK